MPVNHSSETVDLEPAKLGSLEQLAIGRLVRACAEIEDACTLFIASVAKVSDSIIVILMGQTAISKRLAVAKYLALVRGEEASARYDKLFPKHLKEVIDCRNAVSHGVLLGRWPKSGRWAFETTKTEAPNEQDMLST